jgi:hypothetical protein
MTNRTKLSLAAAALVVAGIGAAPAFSTVAPAGQVASVHKTPGIAVMAPTSADQLGTIWFDVGGSSTGSSFGGPR